jgi:hypothetical protein
VSNRDIRYGAVIAARLPAEAADRPPSIMARRLILEGLARAGDQQKAGATSA